MVLAVYLTLYMLISSPILIFDFSTESDISGWVVVDDVVMGGRSEGTFFLSEEGYGIFQGNVSLDNNGGFSSVRYSFPAIKVNDRKYIKIRVRGDEKNYQFRIKDNKGKAYSYITTFHTSGEWQEIIIKLDEMYPSFRGRELNQSNFSHSTIEEVTFLIANKKNESFRLLIDSIILY